MLKKTLYVCYCALFFLCCAFFALGAFFHDDTSDTSEGRELSSFPAWTEDGAFNTDFFTEFDAWMTDRFTGRQTLITLNARIRETIFATGSDQVIVGRDHFLFYADTAADFTGESALSEEEINAAADALARLNAYAKEHGATLIVAVAPNKNTIYPDKMPAVYQKSASPSNLDRLHDALALRDVAYTDLRTALTDDDALLYHRRDTHWNGLGALRAYNAILDTVGIAHEDYADIPLVTTCDFAGDLDELLYPAVVRYDENTMPDFDFSSAFLYTSAYRTSMDMTITTRGHGEKTALIFRDSFGSAWIPYFSAAFAEVRYERAVPYRIDILEQFDADLVIVEIAERNIAELISAADRLTDTAK